MKKEIEDYKAQSENPYLIIDFWHFAILSTLMVVFFPWSLLFCVVFYGLDETKLICLALIHDAIKTILAILSVVVLIVLIIAIIVLISAG